MNYTFNRHSVAADTETKPLGLGFLTRKGHAATWKAKNLKAFCVSDDRPKHDSWWPQVGQNFKNRDTVMLAERLAGATPISRGTGRIDKSGDFARSMSIRLGGVNPFLPFNG